MKRLLLLILLAGCHARYQDTTQPLVSMQTLDRNGFSETVSTPERLKIYQNVNFMAAQPYKKVMRVYGKNNEGKSLSKISSYHDNGQIWQFLEALDGRANGAYREWYENGSIKIEGTLIEGMADLSPEAQRSWLFDKQCTVWDEEGHKMAEFTYEKGQLEGLANYFYPTGKLKKTIAYLHHQAHGKMQTFTEEGNLEEEISYVRGQKEGTAEGFWKSDFLRYHEEYTEGLLLNGHYNAPEGTSIYSIKNGYGKRPSYQNGKLSYLVEYKEGKPEGTVSHYRPDGTLKGTYQTRDGMKDGEEWEYYHVIQGENRPKLFIHWEKDQIQGMVKTWYETGALESEREMSENRKQGLSFAYYKSGDLMMMEEYDLGKLVKGSYFKKGEKQPISTIERGKGLATFYTPDGQFLRKVEYADGKPLIE